MKLTVLPRLLLLALIAPLALSACSLGAAEPPERRAPTPVADIVGPQPTATTALAQTIWLEIEQQPGDGEVATLAAESEAIFVGAVLDAGEPFEGSFGSIVWTPFQVEVEDVLKGDIAGELTVAQMGGKHPRRNERVVILIDTPESMEELAQLEPGRSYLFATRTTGFDLPDRPGIHYAEPIHGHIPIDDDAQRRQLIAEFTAAIERAAPD